MMIKGVRKSDLGSYRCVSRNPAGETSTTLHLIRPKLSPGTVEAANGLEVRLDPDLKVANLGSSAKFTCRIVDKTKSKTGGEARSYSGKMNDYQSCKYRVGQVVVHLGWVDINFGRSTTCLILLGQLEVWQNGL